MSDSLAQATHCQLPHLPTCSMTTDRAEQATTAAAESVDSPQQHLPCPLHLDKDLELVGIRPPHAVFVCLAASRRKQHLGTLLPKYKLEADPLKTVLSCTRAADKCSVVTCHQQSTASASGTGRVAGQRRVLLAEVGGGCWRWFAAGACCTCRPACLPCAAAASPSASVAKLRYAWPMCVL